MSTVVPFPLDRVRYEVESYRPTPAVILVLPVIKIERCVDSAPLIDTYGAEFYR